MTIRPSPTTAPAPAPARRPAGVFNTEHVAYVYNQRGYHVNEFASRLDLSNDTVEQFLRGTVEPGDLRITTLVKMADLLGIPLHSLFAQPALADDPETVDIAPDVEPAAEQVRRDAEQLIAVLYDTGRTTATLISEIAKTYKWTLEHTYNVCAEADRRLRPAGLQAHTSHGEVFISPVRDHHQAHRALTERKTYERGLTYTHYKAIHQMLEGNQVTVNKSGRQRLLTLGGLANLDIINDPRRPALTKAAQEAFL